MQLFSNFSIFLNDYEHLQTQYKQKCKVPRPLLSPQPALKYGSYIYNARWDILTQMCCSRKYPLIDLKKCFHMFLGPTNRPQTSKIVHMNADISKTIKAKKLVESIKIKDILANRKRNSAGCQLHFNAHKPPKTVSLTFSKIKILNKFYFISLLNTFQHA